MPSKVAAADAPLGREAADAAADGAADAPAPAPLPAMRDVALFTACAAGSCVAAVLSLLVLTDHVIGWGAAAA